MYGGDEPADPYSSWLVLATDADGTYFLVFDVQTARYLQVPAICPHEAKVVATTLGDLLEWIVNDLKLAGGELPGDD